MNIPGKFHWALRLFKPFMRYQCNKIFPDEPMNNGWTNGLIMWQMDRQKHAAVNDNVGCRRHKKAMNGFSSLNELLHYLEKKNKCCSKHKKYCRKKCSRKCCDIVDGTANRRSWLFAGDLQLRSVSINSSKQQRNSKRPTLNTVNTQCF